MNAPASAQFIFNWDQPRRRSLILIGFIVASFVIHVAASYLFQVVYPQTVSLLPAPRRVSLMIANSEQTATLLRWIDSEDPALVSTTRRPPHLQRREMGKVEHVPSYFAREPALKEPPPLAVDLRIPSAQPPGPVPAAARIPASPIGVTPTKVTFADGFDRVGQPTFVSTKFRTSTHEPPQNAQFRIAVDSQGAVVYCFNLTSSGDAALDEQAREHLALCRFPAPPGESVQWRTGSTSNGDSLVWGIATIEWGNDVAPANTKPTPGAP
jgi:hypothetical protein